MHYQLNLSIVFIAKESESPEDNIPNTAMFLDFS